MEIKRFEKSSRMSQVVTHGETIYLSGQVPDNWESDISQQTREVLEKIENLLVSVGSNKSKILSAQIWLADVREFEDMNVVWEAWIDPENPPARATTGPALGHQLVRVEIAVIAAV